MPNPSVSIVVPFYNEEKNIPELYKKLIDVLDQAGRTYELVFVNDGSRDNTYGVMCSLQEKDERVNVINLRRNYGQTGALSAGFDFAEGDIIIAMDGDLQHDPEDIPALLAKIDEGYDIASGWRADRKDAYLTRKLPSRIANWLMAKLSGIPLHDFGTTFKAYKKDIIRNVHIYGELHRFIPALASPYGAKIAEVPIKNILRLQGKSNYNLTRTIRVFFDLITVKFLISYLGRPLQFFGMAGLGLFLLGFVTALSLTVMYYTGVIEMRENLGNLIFSVLMIILGIQLIGIGLSMEISTRIYHETQNKKIYSIREIKTRRE